MLSGLIAGLRRLLRAWQRHRALHPRKGGSARHVPATVRANRGFWRGAAFIVAMVGLLLLGLGFSGTHCRRRPELAVEYQLQGLNSAIEEFRSLCGALPSRLDDLVDGHAVSGCRARARISQANLRDHWGTPFRYVPGPDGSEFRLLSIGVDRKQATVDDIVAGDADRPWRASYRPPFDWVQLPVLLALLLPLVMVAWAVLRSALRLIRYLPRRWRSRRQARSAGRSG